MAEGQPIAVLKTSLADLKHASIDQIQGALKRYAMLIEQSGYLQEQIAFFDKMTDGQIQVVTVRCGSEEIDMRVSDLRVGVDRSANEIAAAIAEMDDVLGDMAEVATKI